MSEKYYKVVGGEGLSPSTKFDYNPYLPKEGVAGDWLPLIPNARLAEDGYYISKYWNFWYSAGARVYEVDFRYPCFAEICAVEDQICCGQIRLLRDITDEVLKTLVDERFNTGQKNSGERNVGNHNVGDRNTGDNNTGKLNTGDFNTGDRNTGIDNVGDFNRGSGNVGSHNIGHSNTGDGNVGSFNSGNFNNGNANTGAFNVGNRNCGKWNLGNRHCGFFNTLPAPVMMFDKPCEIDVSSISLPKWLNRKNCADAFWDAPAADVEAVLKLPNFDFEIFYKITKISRADFSKKLGREL